MKSWLIRGLGLAVIILIVSPPVIRYRSLYAHHKRLREVTAGHFYRAGQLTAEGLRDAVQQLGIKTVVNVQDEFPDPLMVKTFWDRAKVGERGVCQQLGVRYVYLAPDLKAERNDPEAAPDVLVAYFRVLDDPTSYPVLLHCRAGLHRTGVLTAVYRMEYEGWSHAAATAELKGNGFDVSLIRYDCNAANDYVKQYVLNYRPRNSRRTDAPTVGAE